MIPLRSSFSPTPGLTSQAISPCLYTPFLSQSTQCTPRRRRHRRPRAESPEARPLLAHSRRRLLLLLLPLCPATNPPPRRRCVPIAMSWARRDAALCEQGGGHKPEADEWRKKERTFISFGCRRRCFLGQAISSSPFFFFFSTFAALFTLFLFHLALFLRSLSFHFCGGGTHKLALTTKNNRTKTRP